MTDNGHERAKPLRTGDPHELGGYRIEGRLGRGGMGTVYLARDAAERRVAVKLIHPDLSDDPDFRRRFAREVESARKVARFSTAGVMDARLDGDPLFIVSEYVSGPNLAQAIGSDGPMSGGTLESLALGVAAALTAIHRAGVVHRDLKPGNVLLSAVGPKVIDFGIARAMDDESAVTRSSQLMGTPSYLAPELIAGGDITPASDIFSWGCLVAYAGIGKAPFDAQTVPAVLHLISSGEADLDGLDPRLVDITRSALDKDPRSRPTAQQLLNALVGHEDPAEDTVDSTVVGSWTPPSTARDEAGDAAAAGAAGGAVAGAAAAGVAGAGAAAGHDDAATEWSTRSEPAGSEAQQPPTAPYTQPGASGASGQAAPGAQPAPYPPPAGHGGAAPPQQGGYPPPGAGPHPYGPVSGPQQAYGPSGPQQAYGPSGPQPGYGAPPPTQPPYGPSQGQPPYGPSGPQPPYGPSGPQPPHPHAAASPPYGAPAADYGAPGSPNGPAAPPGPGGTPPGPDPGARPKRRRTAILAGAGAAALLLVATGVGAVVVLNDGPPEGSLIYEDDFAGGAWDYSAYDPEDEYLEYAYHPDYGLVMRVSDINSYGGSLGAYIPYEGRMPEAVRVSAEATVLAGPAYGEFGVRCYHQENDDDEQTHYEALVRFDGASAQIRRVGGDSGSAAMATTDDVGGFEPPPQKRPLAGDPLAGGQGDGGGADTAPEDVVTNTVTMACVPDEEAGTIAVDLWVNGDHVLEAVDEEPLPDGAEDARQTGVTVKRGGSEEDIAMVGFSRVEVQRLGEPGDGGGS